MGVKRERLFWNRGCELRPAVEKEGVYRMNAGHCAMLRTTVHSASRLAIAPSHGTPHVL